MTLSMIRSIVVALGAAALVTGAASTACADDEDWRHGREHRERWGEHEWHKWCRGHPGAFAYPGYYCPGHAPPPVVVAPPPAVIYAPPPPPVVYAPPPPPLIGIEVPVHIR